MLPVHDYSLLCIFIRFPRLKDKQLIAPFVRKSLASERSVSLLDAILEVCAIEEGAPAASPRSSGFWRERAEYFLHHPTNCLGSGSNPN